MILRSLEVDSHILFGSIPHLKRGRKSSKLERVESILYLREKKRLRTTDRLIHLSIHPIASRMHSSIQSITMTLSSHASVWKPAHEADAAVRENSAPTGTPIGKTRLLSLGQHATIGWKQKQQNLHQQQHKQPKRETSTKTSKGSSGQGQDW